MKGKKLEVIGLICTRCNGDMEAVSNEEGKFYFEGVYCPKCDKEKNHDKARDSRLA